MYQESSLKRINNQVNAEGSARPRTEEGGKAARKKFISPFLNQKSNAGLSSVTRAGNEVPPISELTEIQHQADNNLVVNERNGFQTTQPVMVRKGSDDDFEPDNQEN